MSLLLRMNRPFSLNPPHQPFRQHPGAHRPLFFLYSSSAGLLCILWVAPSLSLSRYVLVSPSLILPFCHWYWSVRSSMPTIFSFRFGLFLFSLVSRSCGDALMLFSAAWTAALAGLLLRFPASLS